MRIGIDQENREERNKKKEEIDEIKLAALSRKRNGQYFIMQTIAERQ